MRRPRRVLTPANVIACTALFVALGGTGWAGQVIGRGAVGSTQLKSNAVTSSKIANGAVTKAKLAPGIGEGVAAGKITKVDAPIAAVPANSTGTVVTAVCPAGSKASAVAGARVSTATSCPRGRRPTAGLDGDVRDVRIAGPVSVSAMCIAP